MDAHRVVAVVCFEKKRLIEGRDFGIKEMPMHLITPP